MRVSERNRANRVDRTSSGAHPEESSARVFPLLLFIFDLCHPDHHPPTRPDWTCFRPSLPDENARSLVRTAGDSHAAIASNEDSPNVAYPHRAYKRPPRSSHNNSNTNSNNNNPERRGWGSLRGTRYPDRVGACRSHPRERYRYHPPSPPRVSSRARA